MTNSNKKSGLYLKAAEEALRTMDEPATANRIVAAIQKNKRLKYFVKGQTPSKTIQARIATDIKKNGAKSIFYRTAPATFGLREYAEKGIYHGNQKEVYVGFNRAKQLEKGIICALNLNNTKFRPTIGFYQSSIIPRRFLENLPLTFCEPKKCASENVLILKTFILVRHKEYIICYEPTKYNKNQENLSNLETIGISGYFRENDRDLFDQSNVGLVNAATREFRDFLIVFRSFSADLISNIEYGGIVYDEFTAERQNQLGVVVIIDTNEKFELQNSKLGMRNIHWRSLSNIPNSFSNFEPWSQHVFVKMHEARLELQQQGTVSSVPK